MPDVQEVFRMSTQKVRPDPGALERQHTRQRRRSVGKKTGAFAVAAAIGLALAALVWGTAGDRDRTLPADTDPTATPAPAVRPFLVDVGTGAVTPLPEALAVDSLYAYAASPDGTRLAFSLCLGGGCFATDLAGTVAIDGSDLRPLDLPEGRNAYGPRWSPDGRSLVYQIRPGASNRVGNLFVEEFSTGARRRITDFAPSRQGWWYLRPLFAPDGRSVVFHLARGEGPTTTWDAWSVPADGGAPTLLLRDAQFPVPLPDGRIAFVQPAPADLGGPSLRIAEPDGTRRTLAEAVVKIVEPEASPDGTRIVYADGGGIYVLDLRTERTTWVFQGSIATWFDDDTILVTPDRP
jgi:dipeptidyl aminopeptidase/acylaminoacyl peptidase